jgi:hypothetical protein
VKVAVAALVVALLAPAAALGATPAPDYVRFEGADPAGLVTPTAGGCETFINTRPGGGHFLDAPCQPTLRLSFARPQATVELFARALDIVPELVAVAHKVGGASVSVRVPDPVTWKPIVLSAAGAEIDYVDLRAEGADIGVDDLALSEYPQPDTTLSGGPGDRTTDTSAAFGYSANRTDISDYRCSLDGGAFTTCGALSGLGVGSHTLQAAAVDAYGAIDPSPATRGWTVLPPAPDTTATGDYRGFTFGSPDPGATFECRIDDQAFAACTSPYVPAGLAPGRHVFEVRALGAAGQPDPSAANVTFDVPVDRDADGIPDAAELLPIGRPPQEGATTLATADEGEVRVQLPGTSAYVPFKGVASLPVGSVVDTIKGTVTVRVASNGYAPTDRRYRDAEVTLSAGIFRIRQARVGKGLTRVVQVPVEFVLVSAPGAEARCRSRAPGKGVVRTLTARGKKGVFRVTGAASRADGRAATWTTTDRCDGTLTRVRRGHAKVRALRAHRTVIVRAGHRYFARARLFRAKKGRALAMRP